MDRAYNRTIATTRGPIPGFRNAGGAYAASGADSTRSLTGEWHQPAPGLAQSNTASATSAEPG